MTETAKTITYVGIAAVMAAAGLFLAPGGPKVRQDAIADLIGTEFYPEFTKPAETTSIDVIGYDPATATVTPFSVKYEDGLWRIPTRHNYPADAKDRLAKVAASIIGLKREALAGRTEAEQAEFQVLDPQAEKSDSLKGIGNRVTLKNGNTVLADYIIGKAVPNKAGYFYVRKPGEKQTFLAKVDLNLSTKFTDWIESDVLSIDGPRLTLLDIIKHSLEIKGQRARLAGQERNTLTRNPPSDPWQLEGLDADKEEVDQDAVRKLVTALDDLKIVGVRPKPAALRKGLSENEGITLDPQTEADLASRGFFFQPTQRGGVQMISMEGDLIAGTDQAVEYELHFGDAFDGTTEEIEFDFAKPKADDATADEPKSDDEKTDDEAAKAEADGEKSGADDDATAPGKKKSRYMFVTARINPELLGPEPVEPIKPEPPSDSQDSDTTEDEDAPADAAAPTSADAPAADPQAAYAAAMQQYEVDKSKYESDIASRESKLKEAEEKIKTLNARFAEWYYVISAENFADLRQGRGTLVKAKPDLEPPAGEATEGDKPQNDFEDKPEESSDDKPKSEDAPKPDDEKPE